MHEEGAVTNRMCQNWFAKFCARDFLLKDVPRPGIPVDSHQIKTSIENNQHYTTWEIAECMPMAGSW